jgi:hypothetical protein
VNHAESAKSDASKLKVFILGLEVGGKLAPVDVVVLHQPRDGARSEPLDLFEVVEDAVAVEAAEDALAIAADHIDDDGLGLRKALKVDLGPMLRF